MLVRLVYVSRICDAANSKKVEEEIFRVSREHNQPRGITGILCVGSGIFLQAIEGGRAAVNTLYTRIIRDERHTDVQLLRFQEIKERQFGGWAMGRVNLESLNTSTVLKYSEKPELDPYAVSGDVSMALLEELMATAAIVGKC